MAAQILSTWTDLSDGDMDAVEGDYEKVVTLLSDRCGYGWHEAADRLDEVLRSS